MALANENNDCYNQSTESQIVTGALLNGIPGMLCFALMAVVLVFELVFLWRIKNSFLLRLFVYLSITVMMSVGASALRLTALLDAYNHPLCKALFIIDRYGQNVRMILIISINITLLHKVFTNTIQSCRLWLRQSGEMSRNARLALEVVFVFVHLALPAMKYALVISLTPGCTYWIPWGLCQCSRTVGQDCEGANRAIELQFLLEIFVLGVVGVVLSLSSIVTLIGCLCWLQRKHYLKKQLRTVIKEMSLFFGFLVTYCLSWVVLVSIDKLNNAHIELATLAIYPVSYLIIPISFLVYMIMNLCPRDKRPDSTSGKNLLVNKGLDVADTTIRLSETSENTPILQSPA